MIYLLAGLMIVAFLLVGIYYSMKIAENIKKDGMAWYFIMYIVVIWLTLGLASWFVISIAM